MAATQVALETIRRAGRGHARYGVEIRGFRMHAEVSDLRALLSKLDGVDGMVSVIDRQTKRGVFYSTTDEARRAILEGTVLPGGLEP